MTKTDDKIDLGALQQDIEDAIAYHRDARTAVMEANMSLSDAHKWLNRATKVLEDAVAKVAKLDEER